MLSSANLRVSILQQLQAGLYILFKLSPMKCQVHFIKKIWEKHYKILVDADLEYHMSQSN